MIQSSLAHGDVYPNLCLSLSDVNILDSLTLNVKTHGYNYAAGTEVICICYRIYFKPLFSLNPMCKRIDKDINETILIETNFNIPNIPENWSLTRNIPKNPIIQSDFSNITQTNEGIVNIQFNDVQRNICSQKRSLLRSNSLAHDHISPFRYMVDQPQPSRSSTSYIRETKSFSSPYEEEGNGSSLEDRVNELKIYRNDIVHDSTIESSIQKLEILRLCLISVFRF